MRRLTFLAVVMLACLLPPLAKADITCTAGGSTAGVSTEACLNFIEPVVETSPVIIDATNWVTILSQVSSAEFGTFIGATTGTVGQAYNFNFNIYEPGGLGLSDTLTLTLNVYAGGLFSATSTFVSDVEGIPLTPLGLGLNTHTLVETGGLQYVDLTYNTGSGTLNFNPTMELGFQSDAAPDGGVTAMLLGVALVGLETLRRKVHA